MSKLVVRILIYLVISLLYAVVRYNIIGDVCYKEIPVFITNKAVSFASIFVLLEIILAKKNRKPELLVKLTGFFKVLIFIHVILSLVLMPMGYFSELIDGNRLSFDGNMVVVSGTLLVTYLFSGWFKIRNTFVLSLLGVHLIFLGARKWFTFDSDFGYLPPITLLCFIFLIIGTVVELQLLFKR